MLAHIFGRLWQKACATTWYRLNPEPVAPAVEPAPFEPFTSTSETPPAGPVADVDAPASPEIEATPEDASQNPEPLK